MKYSPQKVFILKNKEYIEISYKEFCKLTEENSNIERYKYFLPLHGMLMEVTEDSYREFYKDQRRQKYLDERSIQNGDFSYDMLTTDEFNGEEILVDESQDIGEMVADRIMVDKLQQAIHLLSEEERMLIQQHFFLEISQMELSGMYGVNQSNISRRITKILQKLKKYL